MFSVICSVENGSCNDKNGSGSSIGVTFIPPLGEMHSPIRQSLHELSCGV